MTTRTLDDRRQPGFGATPFSASRGLHRVLGGLRSGWRRYAGWREARRAIRDLGALDDRQLRDMGIARSQIMAAALGLDVDVRRRRDLHE